MRLLIAEDDPMLGDSLCGALKNAGYAADWVTDGIQALSALRNEGFDLLILDLGLPGLDGIRVLQEIRGQGQEIPVLILTARDSTGNKVEGLDAGADDYLLKPFDLDELMARIRALLRRRQQRAITILSYGDVRLEPATFRAWYKEQPVTLARREFALLEIFLGRPGQVFTRQQLQESIYSWDDDVGSNALEVHIHHLRKKFCTDLIRTIRGIGYTLGDSDL